jgi:hypothetical protein
LCPCHPLTPHLRRDNDGSNGIAAIVTLLDRFLSPAFSESGGIFVGELIMHLFRKAGGAIGPVLPDLLRAIVGRLAVAKLPSYIQVGCVDGLADVLSTFMEPNTRRRCRASPLVCPSCDGAAILLMTDRSDHAGRSSALGPPLRLVDCLAAR